MRILKCNQLFKGGINYPIIYKKFNLCFIFQKSDTKNVNFWFVPCQNSKFYVVKVLDKLKEKN
ncbi:Protein YidD [Campylobacter concisus ATCC 51562]|uniref:Protein YidD n=2 Tax=Campylobacter concisus TaxID=199 RepID=U2F8I5_9BACT|nr:Protein YidD [Campylobacter concisus ATCC 51562]